MNLNDRINSVFDVIPLSLSNVHYIKYAFCNQNFVNTDNEDEFFWVTNQNIEMRTFVQNFI